MRKTGVASIRSSNTEFSSTPYTLVPPSTTAATTRCARLVLRSDSKFEICIACLQLDCNLLGQLPRWCDQPRQQQKPIEEELPRFLSRDVARANVKRSPVRAHPDPHPLRASHIPLSPLPHMRAAQNVYLAVPGRPIEA